MKLEHLSKLLGLTLTCFLLVSSSCDKGGNDPGGDPGNSFDDYDRTAMLENYADNYILPAYDAFNASCQDLHNAAVIFIFTTDQENLDALRIAWKNTLLIWQDVAFLELGPAANISLRSQVNLYPVDTNLIKDLIDQGSYDLQLPGNFVAKGFQSLDYLLYGIASTDAAILEYYQTTPQAKDFINDVC